MNEIIATSRTHARQAGLKLYYGRKSCPHGHPPIRYASAGVCVECTNSKSLARYHADPVGAQQRAANWAKNNPEKIRLLRGEHVTVRRKGIKRWKRQHRAELTAYESARRAAKLQATLPGYELELIEIYKTCPRGWHVDHIVPLNGRTVCGLHVPWNLQHLPARENMGKGNKLVTPAGFEPASYP